MTTRDPAWRLLVESGARTGVFEEALLPHLDVLYGLALRLTGDRDEAEDLLHDAVLRAFEKFHQLRNPGAARAWLTRVLTTVHLNRRSVHGSAAPGPPEEVEPVSDETPEAELLRRADAEDVDAALRGLPHDYRLTILMADVEEKPLREIATLCGCPIGTVASRLARARALLRKRLEEGRDARRREG